MGQGNESFRLRCVNVMDCSPRQNFEASRLYRRRAHEYLGRWTAGCDSFPANPVFWFKDGIFVTGAAQPFQSLLAGRLTRIGRMTCNEASELLTRYMAHDNYACVRIDARTVEVSVSSAGGARHPGPVNA